MFAGEDLRRSQDMGVDESLIDPQERLVSAGADPGGLSSVLGTDVGHGRRLGVPVGHVQDGPAQLSFLENEERVFAQFVVKYIKTVLPLLLYM